MTQMPSVMWFEDLGRGDVARVGGKNASLGEMVRSLGGEASACRRASPRPPTPTGASSTRTACRRRIAARARRPRRRQGDARRDRPGDPPRLPARRMAGRHCGARSPPPIASSAERAGKADADVAVRSSATAEDLPEASFAGQQETFLNIRGETALLDACRRCYASLFTDRAISYRQAKGFDHMKVALSIGVQHMVRSDLGGSGVMFSIDTETGFDKVVLINAAWGLGENVVQGAVDPDEYQVFKPLLADPSLDADRREEARREGA